MTWLVPAVAGMLVVGFRVVPAHASEAGSLRAVGVGLVAGSTPGLTAKIWTHPTGALDLGLGMGLGTFACTDRFNPCSHQMSLNVDYLWQLERGLADRLSYHVGPGVRVWFWSYGSEPAQRQIAGRLPLGIDLYFLKWLEVFAEVAPSLGFAPSRLFLEGAVGARMYP